MNKTALITGISGQDGYYLADFLLRKNYQVHGVILYAAAPIPEAHRALQDHPNFHLHYGDLTDSGCLWQLLGNLKPDEIYNLGAQSQVKVSFAVPEATADINALGTLRLLEAVRGLGLVDKTRLYQASSSEMFGNAATAPQNEQTPFAPCSPYGIAKLFAYWQVRTYRQAYGLHASNGILFNHESPLRGESFVTRKISRAVAAIRAGRQSHVALGNLDAARDWGHAADYVEGMWLMLQQDQPGDYVLATGQTHTVRDFATAAFAAAGVDLVWDGKGLEEKAFDSRTGAVRVYVDPAFFRPLELHTLRGDATRAREVLGWQPRRDFTALVTEMVSYDQSLLKQDETDYALFAAE